MSTARGIRVSFIVLSRNSERVIERCVRSLLSQADSGNPDELWVVDNGSTDNSRQIVESLQHEFPGRIETIYLARNFGTTVSRNQALRRASGQYVAIVDSDVDVPAGVVNDLIRTIGSRPRCGLVAPRLLYPDGRLQLSTDQFPTITHKIRRYLSLRRMERVLNETAAAPAIRDVDYAIAAFWLLKREVVERIGVLDERIFYAPEDVDYCLRIWKAGYTCVQDSTVHAVHDAQEISRVAPWRRMALLHLSGLIYLFFKHKYVFSTRRIRRAIARAA